MFLPQRCSRTSTYPCYTQSAPIGVWDKAWDGVSWHQIHTLASEMSKLEGWTLSRPLSHTLSAMRQSTYLALILAVAGPDLILTAGSFLDGSGLTDFALARYIATTPVELLGFGVE